MHPAKAKLYYASPVSVFHDIPSTHRFWRCFSALLFSFLQCAKKEKSNQKRKNHKLRPC